VKGEVEQALARLRPTRLDVIRPGLLRGARRERRPAERIAMLLSPLIDLFLRGKYAKYRSVSDAVIARAIVGLTKEKAAGRFVFEHEAILRARRFVCKDGSPGAEGATAPESLRPTDRVDR
ncbi:MAG: hypothetical protein RIQ99_1280, partial [Pseudomonadota bacterium]